MRIVSLSPSLTEILTALGAADPLVGVTDACEIEASSATRLGSPKAIQVSKVGALKPDWILADALENRPEEIEALEKRWHVKLFDVRKIDDVCDTVAELGRLTGRTEEAKRLYVSIQNELKLNEETFQERPKKRTALLIWDQPYLTVNFDTYPSRLIEASGGVNVFREEPLHEFPVEMEDLLERDPGLLLLPGEPAPFRAKHIQQFRKYRIFSRIPIHLVDGKLFSRYGVQTREALRTFREIYASLSS